MSTVAETPQRVVIAVVGAERRTWLFAPPSASAAAAREIIAGVLATMHVDMDLGRRFMRLIDLLTRAGCRPCVVATAQLKHTGERWRLVGPAEPEHLPDAIALRWGGRRQYFGVPDGATWRSARAAFREAAAEHAVERLHFFGGADAVERVSAIYASRGFPTLRAVTVRCGPLGIDETDAVDL